MFIARSISFHRCHFLILAIIFTTPSPSAEDHPAGERKAIHALCAAANAILASQGEGGILDEIVRYETRRHADAARTLGTTDEDLKQFIEAMSQEYNPGRIKWDEIADLAYGCTEIKFL